jgi:hypothetical protein
MTFNLITFSIKNLILFITINLKITYTIITMTEQQNQPENPLAGMDSNMIIGLLFQAHALNTINSPLIMNKVSGNLQKIKDCVIENGTDYVFNDVFNEFKETVTSFGTVHHEPNFWRGMFGKMFYDSPQIKNYIKMKKGDETITFDNYNYTLEIPNGCCTNDKCPVKIFYEIYNSHVMNK